MLGSHALNMKASQLWADDKMNAPSARSPPGGTQIQRSAAHCPPCVRTRTCLYSLSSSNTESNNAKKELKVIRKER